MSNKHHDKSISRKHRKALKRLRSGSNVAGNLDLTIWEVQLLAKMLEIFDKIHMSNSEVGQLKWVDRIGGGKDFIGVMEVMELRDKFKKLESFLREQHKLFASAGKSDEELVQEKLKEMEKRDDYKELGTYCGL